MFNKEMIALKIKHWVQVTFFAAIFLAIFNVWHTAVTGVQNATEMELLQYCGVVFHYVIFWYILPISIFRMIKKVLNKKDSPKEEPSMTTKAFTLTNNGMNYAKK